MADNAPTRRLATIVALDVAGYSARTEADETQTVAQIALLRPVIEGIAKTHGGRVFNTAGDGFMLEFASSHAAVEAAFELADACTPKVRVGVHVGDTMVQPNGDLLGHGVNVAARLMARAEPGSSLISADVKRLVRGAVADRLQSRGHIKLDKMAETIEVFAVDGAGLQGTAIAPAARKCSICVLPFANMSDDPQQEYFSDGISEDIITDLSKVSALAVTSRNSAFQYKGKHVDLPRVARELNVSHVLEGSVRKAGGRVRITAQLIDGATNDHVWAERYDRDLNDIFALQDEISEAIVNALKIKLLPTEKKAIERRGTTSADAYNLYLLAHQSYVMGNEGDTGRLETIVRLCGRAVEIDPNYARAWNLMALGQHGQRFSFGGKGDGGLAAAERAIALDADLAEAHAVRGRILLENDCGGDDAMAELEIALRLDPDSYEVNRNAAHVAFRRQKLEDAIRHWEKATALAETDFGSPHMLLGCYAAVGNAAAVRRVAQIALYRAERAVAQNQSNGAAMAVAVYALSALGEAERAIEWMRRARLIDPDNIVMHYNFVCALAAYLKQPDAALELLESFLSKATRALVAHVQVDPDLDPLRDHPNFRAMVAAAELRLAAEEARAKS